MMSRMYNEVIPWNVFRGCEFNCSYCKKSFQAQAKRLKNLCSKCYSFEPHEHPERLNKIPSGRIIWPGSSGDISFCDKGFLYKIANVTTKSKYKDKTFYWQSKDISVFEHIIKVLSPINNIFLTTLETNRDKNYRQISKAPYPTDRAYDFMKLPWPRKIVTIEPIMDFDTPEFLKMILDINPEMVWLGYNSRPKSIKLHEPPMDKTKHFIAALQANGIPVKTKNIPWEYQK